VTGADPDPTPHSEWQRRRGVAERYFGPWLDRILPLKDRTVLEYGCGTGAVCVALAPRVGRYVGYDIDESAVSIARTELDRAGASSNVELHSYPADRILEAVEEHGDEPDIVLLYAVLEHMTIAERLELIELAFRIVRRDGLVAVVESPNRLAPVDWHTSFLPFLCQLPEDLAIEYAKRSPRDDYREAMSAAAAVGPEAEREALTRWGRGVSFHEFELILGDLTQRVVGGGYDPELLPERPMHLEEQLLSRQMERVRPDLPPIFRRYWLDMALTPEPVDPSTTRLIWPWILDTRRSAAARWTRWEAIELDADGQLTVDLPVPTRRIVASVTLPEPSGEVTVRSGDSTQSTPVTGRPGDQMYVAVELPLAQAEVALSLSHAGYVHFVGYEASGARGPVP
jgi:SAM-dependent methyltransferase